MKYFLQGRGRRSSRVRITAKEFHEIKQAKEALSHFRTLTETYRVVVESYRTVERAKHDAELDSILHQKAAYRSFLDASVVLNSAIVAYLVPQITIDGPPHGVLTQLMLTLPIFTEYKPSKSAKRRPLPEYHFRVNSNWIRWYRKSRVNLGKNWLWCNLNCDLRH